MDDPHKEIIRLRSLLDIILDMPMMGAGFVPLRQAHPTLYGRTWNKIVHDTPLDDEWNRYLERNEKERSDFEI